MIQKHLFSTTLIFFVKENSSWGNCQGNYTGIAEKKLSG